MGNFRHPAIGRKDKKRSRASLVEVATGCIAALLKRPFHIAALHQRNLSLFLGDRRKSDPHSVSPPDAAVKLEAWCTPEGI